MQYSLLAHSVYINFDQSDFKAEIIHLYSNNVNIMLVLKT